jgi:hypothetical protein
MTNEIKLLAALQSKRPVWLAEVWSGDGWLVLGAYLTEQGAKNRIDRSKSHQEHRCRTASATHDVGRLRAAASRSKDYRRELRDCY